MKKRASVTFGRLHLKSVVLAMLLFGLLGVMPFLARVHGQSNGGTAAGQATPAGVTTLNKNPLQIAILHWYNANLTTQFTAGTAPFGIAFDGANMWVALNGMNKVVKLRAN